jgi:UPF0755 protein
MISHIILQNKYRWGWIAFVLFPLLILAGLAWQFQAHGPARRDQSVLIDKGASLRQAATQLEKAGIIKSAKHFILLARLFGRNASIKAGEYQMPREASAARILSLLQSGDVLLHQVMIATGMSSLQVYERLMADVRLTGDISVPVEGSIYPDTYTFTRGEARSDVVKRMQRSMTNIVTALWEKRQPNLPFRTPQEAITLAAIVEKETAKKSELPMVAGVYINRLLKGMKLQADPTVIYPVTKGKPLGRRILKSELQTHNEYNTYVITGLPVGPITNPGKRAIEAVLHPTKTDHLFFVADGSGGHVFAQTNDEHARNVAKWRRLRAEKNI